MKTKTAEAISYDGGKFQLRVKYELTNSAIKFIPYVVISKSFKKNQKIKFSWKERKSRKYTEENYPTFNDNSESRDIDDLQVDESQGFTRKVRYPGTYYAKRKKARKKTFKYKKKSKKKTKQYKDDASGVEFSNYDAEVTIQVKVGKKKSKITLTSNLKPNAPGHLFHAWGGGRQRMDLWLNKLKATPMKYVNSIELHRREETKLETQSWTHIATKSAAAMGGDAEHGVVADVIWDYNNGVDSRTFYDDSNLGIGKRFQWKVIAKNKNGESSTADTKWYYTEPPDPSNVTHERLDDLQNKVYFNCDRRDAYMEYVRNVYIQYNEKLPTDPNPNSGWVTLRSNDYTWASTTPGVPAQWPGEYKTDTFAIIHNKCLKDKHYRYRVYFSNTSISGGEGTEEFSQYAPSISGTEVTYNVPNAPARIRGLYNAKQSNIKLTIERQFSYTTADKLFLQRKINNGDWEYVPSNGGSEGIDITPSGSNTRTTYTDTEITEAIGKTITYRAAFGCTKSVPSGETLKPGTGVSDWTESSSITVLAKPNKPTLTAPVNMSSLIQGTSSARLQWVHSPNDGTAQTAAIIKYRINDGAWVSDTIGSLPYYFLPIESLKATDVVHWNVSTKGEHESYSDESKTFVFKIIAKPEIEITSPKTNSVLDKLPLHLAWKYEDVSGSLKNMHFEIRQANDILYEQDIPPEKTNNGVGSFDLYDYLFDNNETFELRLIVESTTTLSNQTDSAISVKYKPVTLTKGYYVSGEFDEDTGYVDVLLEQNGDNPTSNTINGATNEVNSEFDMFDDNSDEEEEISNNPVSRILLYRTYNDETVLVDSKDVNPTATEGLKIEDKYAPVNVNYYYILMQITTMGEVAISYTIQNHQTTWWYIYWGDDQITRARWNPTGSMSVNRPEKQQIRYSGREYPVVYDSNANNETYSLNFKILDGIDGGWDDILDFKNMISYGGHGIWKSFEGDVYAADFDFSYNTDYTQSYKSWDCSLNVTRSESEDL